MSGELAVPAPADLQAHLEARLRVPVLVACLLFVPTVVLELAAPPAPWRQLAAVLNWTTWLVFALEAAALLAFARDRKAWLRCNTTALVVVLVTPPFLPASLQAARFLRLARLVRLVRLAQVAREAFTLEGLRFAGLVTAVAAIAGGTAFGSLEGVSAWKGLWWAVTAMTTAGYLDVAPATEAGKALGLALILVGLAFETMLIGAIAERFVQTRETETAAELEDVVETSHDQLQQELRAIATRLLELEAIVATVAAPTPQGEQP